MNCLDILESALIGRVVKLEGRKARRVIEVEVEYDADTQETVYLSFEGYNYRFRIGLETDFELRDE